jgi:TPR repeat protein
MPTIDYNQQGIDYYEKQDYDNAIIAFKKAIEINPKHDEAYFNMGNAYGKKEDYDNAITAYKKAIEINPKNDKAYHNMGNAYDKKQDYDNAITAFKKAIKINPNNILSKEALSYMENKIEVEKQRKDLSKEMKSQFDKFGGKDISTRIEKEEKELKKIKIYISLITLAIIALLLTITMVLFAIIIIVYSSNQAIYWAMIQSNFTALLVLSPAIWLLKNMHQRKNILELSIHDLKDKHYLISTFFNLDEKNQELHIDKILDIMSKNSTAKLLKGLYSPKIESMYSNEFVDKILNYKTK